MRDTHKLQNQTFQTLNYYTYHLYPKLERRQFYDQYYKEKAQQSRKKIKVQPALLCRKFEKNISEARRTREIRKRGKKLLKTMKKKSKKFVKN